MQGRQTPICVAAENGHKDMVLLLLERGADIIDRSEYQVIY
jgi:ankyrin repeat protein